MKGLNIRAADLAEMQSLSSKNCDVKYLICIIDVLTKYVSVRPLKSKKTKTVLNGFIKKVNECICNRINYRFMQRWLDDNHFKNMLHFKNILIMQVGQ